MPRALVWDYRDPPEDELWRLQRIADFFPHYGRDRETVRAPFRRHDELRIPDEVRELIAMYARHHGIDRES